MASLLRRPTLSPNPKLSNARANQRFLSAEFKEIRKEWKTKKKEEEAQRKAEDERRRQDEESRGADQQAPADQPVYGHIRTPIGPPPQMGGPQLPPIGYAPSTGGASQPQYAQQSPAMEGVAQYAANNQMYGAANNNGSSYPQSPYGQNNQMYTQRTPTP